MKRFVPFEDQWELLESMDFAGLVPYQLGMPCEHRLAVSNVVDFEILQNDPQPWREEFEVRRSAVG